MRRFKFECFFEEDERLIPEEITIITYDKSNPVERVSDWIKNEMKKYDYDPTSGERLEIRIVISVKK